MTDSYEFFKNRILLLTGIDLNAYKEKQMKRRIDTLIERHSFDNYEDYVVSITNDKDLYEEFVNYLTINVSEFYRNPLQWDILEKTILPELIFRFGTALKVWSAACSTGDEPYSLVMSMSRLISIDHIKVYATDIDKQVLGLAKDGIYNTRSIANVPVDMKSLFFNQVSDNEYEISGRIKRRVEFHEQNLLSDLYPQSQHLIVCRNVLIYFTEEAKDEVFKKFYSALAPGGILFIGSTEQMINYKSVGFERVDSFFFRKPL